MKISWLIFYIYSVSSIELSQDCRLAVEQFLDREVSQYYNTETQRLNTPDGEYPLGFDILHTVCNGIISESQARRTTTTTTTTTTPFTTTTTTDTDTDTDTKSTACVKDEATTWPYHAYYILTSIISLFTGGAFGVTIHIKVHRRNKKKKNKKTDEENGGNNEEIPMEID